jgi:hypothetical protein
MRPIPFLALAATLASGPVGAQSTIPLADPGQGGGPNAQAAQRPMGPNALAAQRPLGPNAAVAAKGKLAAGQVHYPSCTAAGAVRTTPLRRGEPGYARHLDPDGDGRACE